MQPQRHRGYVLIDVLTGLSIVVLLIGLLTFSANRQQRASRRLDAQRNATALAERTLTNLQLNQTGPASTGDASVEITDAAAPSAPAGKHWIQVHATVSGRSSDLLGLVPTTSPATTFPATTKQRGAQ